MQKTLEMTELICYNILRWRRRIPKNAAKYGFCCIFIRRTISHDLEVAERGAPYLKHPGRLICFAGTGYACPREDKIRGIMMFLLCFFAAIIVAVTILAILTKSRSVYKNKPEEQNPMEGKKVEFIEDRNEPENADGMRGHLRAVGKADGRRSFYDRFVKRCIDIFLSFCGLIVLSPVFLGVSLWIVIDDPGPVLFSQKRVGCNKRYFKLHKFRSMKVSTPHDRPTHMLDNPAQYITRAGKFIRSHSLDELPQIWDIFVGNMSIIGPRPALWNQDWLIACRDECGANDIRPGLTGWAQINGRDELEISVKAKLDGEYREKESLAFDVRCFIGTVFSVARGDGIVEGGTGEIKKHDSGLPSTISAEDRKTGIDKDD